MVEMLPMVQIVPEMNLALDPASGMIGTSLGKDMIILSMDDVNEGVASIEAAADELMYSLDPNTSPIGAYPGREGVYSTAGMLTNMVYGFLIGLFILFAAIPLLASLGVI
ncbi:tetrahydromethanopterin S-methyltransferase subunit B [Methanobrevibacter sp. DSM 116169]|uniref:tetrahydromethanopterin S-methyltransferase subunit B n=1 Tax=Methanobrevibacter sp. DSM 116169 TaxID=3242727 RepID=UPI0038FC4C02